MTGEKRNRARIHIALLVLLSLLEFAVPLLWRADASLFFYDISKDEGFHLFNAWKVYDALVAHGSYGSLGALFQPHAARDLIYHPPLLYAASLVAQWVAGSSRFAAIYLGTLPFFLLLNLSLYALGRRLHSANAGLIATALLMICPLFHEHLGAYNQQIALIAWLPLLLLALFWAKPLTSTGRVAILFAAVGMAFLSYMWALFFVFFPLALVAVRSAVETKRPGKIVLNLAIGTALFAAMTAPYFLYTDARAFTEQMVPRMLSMDFIRRTVEVIEPDRLGRLHYLTALPWAMGAVFPAMLYGLIRLDWRRETEQTLAASVAGAILVLMAFATVHTERLLAVLVLGVPIAAIGLARTKNLMRHKSVPWAALAVLTAASVWNLPAERSAKIERQPDVREALRLLDTRCEMMKQTPLILSFSSEVYFSAKYLAAAEDFSCLRPEYFYNPGNVTGPFGITHVLHFAGDDLAPVLDTEPCRAHPELRANIAKFIDREHYGLLFKDGGGPVLEIWEHRETGAVRPIIEEGADLDSVR